MTLRCDVLVRDGAEGELRLALRGAADIAAAQLLREQLLAVLSPERDVVLDLEELEKLDGAGAQLVFAVKAFVERAGRKFSLVAGSGAPRRALEDAGALVALGGESIVT
jgi:anti-anti-sigma regulatory factor